MVGVRRPGGREEDTMGLSVRRLWISAFRFGRVRTPVVWLLLVVWAELAASAGVVRRADDVGGRSFRELWMKSRFCMWMQDVSSSCEAWMGLVDLVDLGAV